MTSHLDRIKQGLKKSNKRQPIYFLIDTSSTMNYGDKITMVNTAVKRMLNEIVGNNSLSAVAHISFITFDDEAKIVIPLTPIESINVRKFSANGQTHMGDALKLLAREIYKNDESFNTPAVFLLTDGQANDDLASGISVIKEIDFENRFFAIAVGEDADINCLKYITNQTYIMEKMKNEDFIELFSWFTKIVETIALTNSNTGYISLTSKEGLAMLKGGASLTGLPSARTNQASLGSSGQLMLPPPPKNIKKA